MVSKRMAQLSMVMVVWALSVGAERGQTFTIRDSLVLFGNYNELQIVTPEGAQLVHPVIEGRYNLGYFAYPSIASQGPLLAWGFYMGWDATRPLHKPRFALGIYSRTNHTWKTYGDFDEIGDTGISSDGSKVAFVARRNDRMALMIFDVGTEAMTEGPYQEGMSARGTPSWSPDLSRLAVQISRPDNSSFVAVLDLKTREPRTLGDGSYPQWSRDGQWIAYRSGRTCVLVHPDGTGSTTAMTLKDGWFTHKEFSWGSPVWSPDSKQLLLNVMKNGGPMLDVILLDLQTGRVVTKSKSGLPVFGWIPYRSQ